MKKTIFFITLASFFLASPIFILPRLIKINQVSCKKEDGECSVATIGVVEGVAGKNLRSAKAVLDALFEEEVQVTSFSTKFTLPDHLEVFVVEREPQIALVIGETEFVLIDVEGYVVGRVRETAFPILVARGTQIKGGKAPVRVATAAGVLLEISKAYSIKTATLDTEGLRMAFAGGINMVLPLDKDIDVLLGTIGVVVFQLNRGTQELKMGEDRVVDLRFKNPVFFVE